MEKRNQASLFMDAIRVKAESMLASETAEEWGQFDDLDRDALLRLLKLDQIERNLLLDELSSTLDLMADPFRLMFFNHPQPMVIFDLDSLGILEANQAACELYGFEAEEFCRLNIRDIRPPEDVPLMFRTLNQKTDAFNRIDVVRHRKKSGEDLEVALFTHDLPYKGKRARNVMVQDLTAWRKVERELLEDQDHFRALNALMSDCLLRLWVDEKGRLIPNVVAGNFEKATGLSFSSVQDIAILRKRVCPEDWPGLRDFLKKVLGAARATHLEIRTVDDEGTQRWVELVARAEEPLDQPGGKTVYCSLRNITERIESLREIHENELRFRQIVEQTQGVVWELDPQGLFRYVSPSASSIYGRKQEDLVGKWAFVDLHAEAGFADVNTNLEEILGSRGVIKDRLSTVTRPDGSVIFVRTNGVPVFQADGLFQGYRGVDTDITELMATEEENRSLYELWKTVSGVFPDGLCIARPDGTIEFVNQVLANWHGYNQPLELVGRNILEFLDPEYLELGMKRMAEFLEGIWGSPDEYKLVRKDGGHFFAEINPGLLRDREGKPERLLLVERDTTLRRMAENQVRTFHRAVEQGTSSILITDLDGRIEYVNPRFTEITGYTLQDVRDQTPRVLKSGLYPAGFYQDLWSTIASGKEWKGEMQNRKKNGELHWERVSISPIRDEKGNLYRFLAVKEDVSKEKLIDEALRMSENLKKSVLNSITSSVLVLDPQGSLVESNNPFPHPEAGSGMGSMPPLSTGDNYLEWMERSLAGGVLADRHPIDAIKEVMTGKRLHAETEYFFGTNSGVRSLIQRVSPLTSYPGWVVVVTEDITSISQTREDLKEANLQVRKQNALLKAILESPQGVIIFSLDHNYCYTSFTGSHKQTMKAIWGVEIEVGLNMLDVILLDGDRQKAKANFDRALAGDHFLLIEEYGDEGLLRKAYEDRYSPIVDDQGKVTGLTVFVSDISERKLRENVREFLLTCGSPGTGEEFFPALGHYLEHTLKMDFVQIWGRARDGQAWKLLAGPKGEMSDKPLPQLDTEVMEAGFFLIPDGMNTADWGGDDLGGNVCSFAGIRLEDSWAQPIGMIRALGKSPIRDSRQTETLLKAVAARTAAEMERLQGEEALKESEERFRSLFETMNQGVIYQNQSGQVLLANPSAARILGVPLDLFLNSGPSGSCFKAVTDTGAPFPKEEDPATKALRIGQEVQALMGVMNPALNKMIWIRVHAIPQWKNGEAVPSHVFTTLEDITLLRETLLQLNDLNRNLEEHVANRTREVIRLSSFQEAILSNAGLAIISTDQDGIIRVFNPAAEEMLGYQASELIGKVTPVQFHDPDEMSRKAQDLRLNINRRVKPDFSVFAAILEQQSSNTGEWTYVRKDGMRFPVKLTISSILQENGGVVGYIGIAMDITREKIQMDAIRESEERFQKMFETHGAVMLLVDPKTGLVTGANRAAEMFYGYDFNSPEGINIDEINLRTPGEVKAEMSLALTQKRNFFIFPHKLASGTVRWVEVHSTPIIVQRSRLLFSIIHDITERKLAEEALVHSGLRLTQITDLAPIIIVLADTELKTLFLNTTAESCFGFEKEKAQGLPLSELLGQANWDQFRQPVIQALAGQTSQFETILWDQEGRKRIIQVTLTPYFEMDRIAGVLMSGMDITQRVEAEELVRKRESENRAILTAVPDIMFRLSREGKFLAAYTGRPDLFILPPENFLGKSVRDILSPSISEPAMLAVENAFRSGEMETFEYVLPLPTGQQYFEDRIIAISDSEALSIVRDVTQQKVAEKALHWNESLLKKMAATTPMAFLVADFRTDRILYCNHRFFEIWGARHLEEKAINKEIGCRELWAECLGVLKDPAAFEQAIQNQSDQIGLNPAEGEIPFADGRIIRHVTAQMWDETDLYLGHLSIFEDITLRKTNEEFELIQKKLATSLSAVSEMRIAMDQILDAIMEIDGIDFGGVYLMEPGVNSPVLMAHRGFSDEALEGIRQYRPDSLQAEMIKAGGSLFGNYHQFLPKAVHAPGLDNLQGVAVIPIRHENQVLGSINLASASLFEIPHKLHGPLGSISILAGAVITRIHAEEALLASQLNFRKLFDTIDDFMFILDLQGTILLTNQVVERRLGYSASELKGMHVLEVHPPERREETGFIVKEMIAGRASFCPVPLQTKSGEKIPVETKVIFGTWDDQKVLYGISRDISERQKAEAALKMQSAAFESFAMAIIITNTTGTIKWANSAFSALSGYSMNEVIDQPISKLVKSGKQDQQFYKKMWDTILTGTVWTGEVLNRKKDGSIYPEELTITPVLDHAGRVTSFIAIKIDISLRRQMEESLLATIAREKELNELKSRFVSMASHEFRTPLTSIRLSVENLIAYWNRMKEEQIQTNLRNIDSQVAHLTGVVGEVMQVARIQEGRETLLLQAVDLVEVCAGTIASFNADPHLVSKIQFKYDLEKLFLMADQRLIRQLLNNLISNAVKYSPGKPDICVSLALDGNQVILTVSDKGIGIPLADQAQLFQPFFRAGNVKQIQGNGLGLNIVREAVRLLGGDITFESTEGKGTTFAVFFPEKLIRNE